MVEQSDDVAIRVRRSEISARAEALSLGKADSQGEPASCGGDIAGARGGLLEASVPLPHGPSVKKGHRTPTTPSLHPPGSAEAQGSGAADADRQMSVLIR